MNVKRELVTSRDNRYVKLAASLQERKFREEVGQFVVEGTRSVESALASGWGLEFAILTEEALSRPSNSTIVNELAQRSCEVIPVTEAVYKKAADTETPQGILVVVKRKIWRLHDLVSHGKMPLMVILDQVRDPGNLGTIIRSADAVGASGVILTDGCADVWAPKTVRSTAGSLFHLPLVQASIADIVDFCMKAHIALFATAVNVTTQYTQIDWNQPAAMVFGNEGHGVRPEFIDAAAKQITIPIHGRAESLNVAVSASVLLFEAIRQRDSIL